MTSETEEAGFLAAIIAQPEDDTHRLAYADWLDERAGEWDVKRAEFIRVQVDLATRKPGARLNGKRPIAELRKREQDLYETSADWMLSTLPAAVDGVLIERSEYDGWATQHDDLFVGYLYRGLVAEMRCGASNWFAHGDEVRVRHPVTRVRLTDFPRFIHGKTGLLFVGDKWHCPIDPEVLPDAGTSPDRFRDHAVIARRAVHMLVHHWPGVVFELPSTAARRLPSFAAITAANLAAVAQQAYAAFAPVAAELGDSLAAALLASGAFQNDNAGEPNEAE